MVAFDFVFLENCIYFIFRQLSGTKLPAHKKLCATSINKSIQNGKGKRWYCYASTRILLTLRNILVCESLLYFN